MKGILSNFLRYILLFLLFGQVSIAYSSMLSEKDVRMTMGKMFAYHVENREFSSLVIRRSFRIYMQQFDPGRTYLMKNEVESFLNLTDGQIKQIKKDYEKDCFPEYVRLNQMMQRAIQRNREIRQEQTKLILSQGANVLNQAGPKEVYEYPKTVEELKQKVYWQLIRELKYSMKLRGIKDYSPELTQKILSFREKKNVQAEKAYFLEEKQLQSHQLTVHLLKVFSKSLDSHSGYYSPREAYEIRASLKKEFSGVGIVLREDFDGICVADIVKGGPTDRSQKVHLGDLLIGLNHESTEDKSFEEVLEVMKGKAGSRVTLTLRKAQGEVLEVELIREKIVMNEERISLEVEPFADGVIGKIKVPGFYDNGGKISVEKDLREALRILKSQGKVNGILLDFRENLGGFLSQAIKVSAMFIDGGLIVVSKYADGEVSYARDIDGRHYYGGPLVILISKTSASAAEIVAGSLQDHGAALIVGDERSYGKGSMQYQTLTDENAQAFFKVTVGRYYTASGRSPQIEGVKSDIIVPTRFHSYNIGERYLEYPLSNDNLSDATFQALLKSKKGSLASFAVPYLKPRASKWRLMLNQLQNNSQKRLVSSQNFQFFLKGTQAVQSKKPMNYGSQDLQMQEGVEILKDMAILSKN